MCFCLIINFCSFYLPDHVRLQKKLCPPPQYTIFFYYCYIRGCEGIEMRWSGKFKYFQTSENSWKYIDNFLTHMMMMLAMAMMILIKMLRMRMICGSMQIGPHKVGSQTVRGPTVWAQFATNEGDDDQDGKHLFNPDIGGQDLPSHIHPNHLKSTSIKWQHKWHNTS